MHLLNKIANKIAAAAMVIMFGFSTSYADMGTYMGSVMDQIGNLSPHAYSSQQKGYFVGGTMHVPPLGETIQPLSVTLPSFNNNSCGGINAMMGGFSYLNFQYLVQKLQGIIQAAPALAFEIAIKVLSEQLGGVMNGLEQITNAINGLNFNSCTAMNGIVNTASSAITSAISSSAGAASASQSNGGSDWFGQGITSFTNNIGQGITSLWNSITGGNPNSLITTPQSVNLQETCGIPQGGLLNAAALQVAGPLPSDFIDMMRYYVGDVVPTAGSNGAISSSQVSNTPSLVGTYVSCGSLNAQDMVKNIAHGYMYKATFDQLKNGYCATIQPSQSFTSLVSIVKQNLNDIYQSLATNSQLTNPNAIKLINMSRIPLYSFMQQAAILQNGIAEQLIDELSIPVAYEIAANVSGKMIAVVAGMAANTESNANVGTCNNEGYRQAVKDFVNHLLAFNKEMASAEYTEFNNAKNVYGSFMDQYQSLSKEVQGQLAKIGSNLGKGYALQNSLNK